MARKKKRKGKPKKAKPAQEPKRQGRPPKYTDKDTRDLVLRGLKAGWTFEKVAQLAGIDEDTLRKWRKMDIPAACTEEERKFLGDIKSAELVGELELFERCAKGEQGWQGAAWCLERRGQGNYHKPAPKAPSDPIPVRVEVVDPYEQPLGEDVGTYGDDLS